MSILRELVKKFILSDCKSSCIIFYLFHMKYYLVNAMYFFRTVFCNPPAKGGSLASLLDYYGSTPLWLGLTPFHLEF